MEIGDKKNLYKSRRGGGCVFFKNALFNGGDGLAASVCFGGLHVGEQNPDTAIDGRIRNIGQQGVRIRFAHHLFKTFWL